MTISVKHLGKPVPDVSSVQLSNGQGLVLSGVGSDTGVYVFSSVPDGEYSLLITNRTAKGECGGITVRGGKVENVSLSLEMWE